MSPTSASRVRIDNRALGASPSCFTVSGYVYVDADANGTRDLTESGSFAGVTVTLFEPKTCVSQTTQTDVNGHYSFEPAEGVYIVRVDASTPECDYNEQLAENFTATGPTSQEVKVGPSMTADFGYNPKTAKLISDLSTGTLVSTGQDEKYWRKVMQDASKGRTTKDGISPETVRGWLQQIEGEFLTEPYQFTDGSEVDEALAIVKAQPRTDIGRLRKELLIAELNDISGKGITTDPVLQDALLAWGESVVVAAEASSSLSIGGSVSIAASTSSGGTVGSAISLFSLMNKSRGGGDIPQ
jgi:hypothetical protein